MAKFCDKIGFVRTKETSPGVWSEVCEEKTYYGDITKNTRRWENGEYLNDDVNVGNTISIVADAFAYSALASIRYVWWMGTAWKVTSVEVQSPRLNITIGGVYNGKTA